MSTKLKLLELLKANNGRYISGQELAKTLGVSRNSVWKAVMSLKEQGYRIDGISHVGYRLRLTEDKIDALYIADKLNIDANIEFYEEIESTNNAAKLKPDCSTPQIIIADQQTAGRGRLGRSFYSPLGTGLYLSIAFRPKFGLDTAMLVTAMTSVAVSRAIEEVTGIRTRIKWVNDIYYRKKKVCGILTEAETNFETGQIDKMIVGIGLNCFQCEFPEDIRDTAAYLENPKKEFTRNDLAIAIIREFLEMVNDFDKRTLMREYKTRSFIMGEQIMIFNPQIIRDAGLPESRISTGIKARAIDIDENGGLIVEYLEGRKMRQMETLISGEITIRV